MCTEFHLLEYKQKALRYLHAFQHRRVTPFRIDPLKKFSDPWDPNGYADDCITNDLITDVYLEFSERTRKAESERYLRTLTGQLAHMIYRQTFTFWLIAKCLSVDNTFRAAAKATVVDKNKARSKMMKGGILTMINEQNEIISWVRTKYLRSCSHRV